MAMWNRNSSSKFKNIISQSTLLHPGSPAVYQLRPKKQKFGTLTRVTVGEKSLSKINKTILLVGETGTGKSTLINTLVNYSMGVEFEDNVWFELVEDEKRSQTESQTSDVIVYEIFGFERKMLPFSLTVIDTPGYGDTRGIEHDFIVSQRLFDLFRTEDGVHELHAVGLLMKATENRVSDRLRYIFNSVVSLFGKDLKDKIVILITHSDGMTPENALKALKAANIKCKINEKKQPVHFMFNNQERISRMENNKSQLLNAWTTSKKGLSEFAEMLKSSEPQRLEKTFEVLNSHITITSCVNNLEDRIKLIELKQRQIEQIKEALRKHEEEMKKNENFSVEVDEVYKDKVEICGGMWGMVFFKGAVCCTVCEENCHYPGCTMSHTPRGCKIMKGGRCTVCTGKCPVSVHVKEQWRYMTKTRTVTKTEADMKRKYEKNKLESDRKLSLLEHVQREIQHLKAEKNLLLDESYQHVVTLDHIALNVNSVSTYVHLDFLIEKMEEKGDTQKLQKLKEMRSQVDEGTVAAMKYMFSNLGNRIKTRFGFMTI